MQTRNDIEIYGDMEQEEISLKKFNVIIGLNLLYGFFITYLIIIKVEKYFIDTNTSRIYAVLFGILIYLALIIFGVKLIRTDSVIKAFLGYNLIMLPLGVVLAAAFCAFNIEVVKAAILATAGIALIAIVFSMMMPTFFDNLGNTLFFCLISLIAAECVVMMFGGGHVIWIEYIAVGIFSGYVGFDFHRSQGLTRTVPSAIGAAAELYVDLVNLFIRLLIILGIVAATAAAAGGDN